MTTTTQRIANRNKNLCLCGCGLQTGSTWYPGHDSKAKSRLMDALAQGPDAVAALPFAHVADDLARDWKLIDADGNIKPRATATKGPRTFLLEHPHIAGAVADTLRDMAKKLLEAGNEDVAAGCKAAADVIAALVKQAERKEGIRQVVEGELKDA